MEETAAQAATRAAVGPALAMTPGHRTRAAGRMNRKNRRPEQLLVLKAVVPKAVVLTAVVLTAVVGWPRRPPALRQLAEACMTAAERSAE